MFFQIHYILYSFHKISATKALTKKSVFSPAAQTQVELFCKTGVFWGQAVTKGVLLNIINLKFITILVGQRNYISVLYLPLFYCLILSTELLMAGAILTTSRQTPTYPKHFSKFTWVTPSTSAGLVWWRTFWMNQLQNLKSLLLHILSVSLIIIGFSRNPLRLNPSLISHEIRTKSRLFWGARMFPTHKQKEEENEGGHTCLFQV